ncbi:hypothetical protein, partial [Klebsiella pneumoniae]|uniref:hypothetical protein n=1 Tax=Klebsiella pneumoniae TaxID=573 RepID=UPI002DBAB5C4
LTALSAEFTIGEGELMAHDVPLGCAPDEYDDLISGTCSHLPYLPHITGFYCYFKRQKNALASIWLSFMAMSVHTKWKVIENSQLPGSYFLTILIQKAQKIQQIT